MSKTLHTDLCIIGAGSGGLSVAAGAAQLGKKVVLIEHGKMGGDCLNYGCVPSKALLTAAGVAQTIKKGRDFGVHAGALEVDYGAAMDHVHRAIATIAPHDSQERFEGLGCTVLRDTAKFTGPRQVTAGDTVVNAKFIIVATGSSPFVPPIPGLADVPFLTNETLFENRTKPDHLLVIGGGPIGIEMAQAHARLGSAVTLIEAGPTIMGNDDPELVAVVRENLTREGITILENTKAMAVSQSVDGSITVTLDGDGPEEVSGSHLLMAVGRRANTQSLDLAAAGVNANNRGIEVNDFLQTSNDRVYAIGDVAGSLQFTHVAGYHASLIIRNLLFKLSKGRNKASEISPWVTYCDPELAHVGMSEAQAQASGNTFNVQRWSFDENDRAIAEAGTAGLVKVITAKNGKVLGASIVGKNAGDLIQPWALAVANGQKIKAFTNYIAPYPTRGEASKRVAGAFFTETLFSARTKGVVKLLSMFD
ncbi:MAG: FAD-dependent oxidoreductase [Pseudomonadota bacterium]